MTYLSTFKQNFRNVATIGVFIQKRLPRARWPGRSGRPSSFSSPAVPVHSAYWKRSQRSVMITFRWLDDLLNHIYLKLSCDDWYKNEEHDDHVYNGRCIQAPASLPWASPPRRRWCWRGCMLGELIPSSHHIFQLAQNENETITERSALFSVSMFEVGTCPTRLAVGMSCLKSRVRI